MGDKIYLIILGTMGLEANLVLIAIIFNLMRTFFHKTKRQYSLLIGALFIIEYSILQVFFEILSYRRDDLDIGFDNNTIALILLQAAITGVTIIFTQMVYRWDCETLSKKSLKNGLDSLPVGLLYYWKGGMVKLVNSKMDRISHLIIHEGIYNGNEFWDMICKKNMRLDYSKEKNENECLVRLEDGPVYSFKRNVCIFEKHELFEIIATDVSEEQLLNEKLKIKRIKADEIKNRLKILNSDIEKMTVEKEILETKSKVHDDLGKTLIMSKRCLQTKDEKLCRDVIKQWKLNTLLLRGEENDDELFEYSNVLREIRKLGMNVRVEGIMPSEPEQKKVLLLAIKTCATNALKHGEATEITVKAANSIEKNIVSVKEKDFLKVEITNNGKLPDGEFREGGGLGNLRTTIERTGGVMDVETDGVFKVILRLPIGRRRIGIE